jgi:phosphoglycolate phosphatase-like HAD superfamily hydrolase
MATVQVALTDAVYREALEAALARAGVVEVQRVSRPDPHRPQVLVVDRDHLEMLRWPIEHPGRVVLIVGDQAEDLSSAWEAGVRSVVGQSDALNTAVLAILGAMLNLPKPRYADPK